MIPKVNQKQWTYLLAVRIHKIRYNLKLSSKNWNKALYIWIKFHEKFELLTLIGLRSSLTTVKPTGSFRQYNVHICSEPSNVTVKKWSDIWTFSQTIECRSSIITVPCIPFCYSFSISPDRRNPIIIIIFFRVVFSIFFNTIPAFPSDKDLVPPKSVYIFLLFLKLCSV